MSDSNATEDLAAATWRQLKDLTLDTVRLQGRYARAVVAAARAAGRGDPPDVKEIVTTVGTQWRDYTRELGRINLGYARSVQKLATGTAQRLIDAVEPDRPPPRSGPTAGRAPARPASPPARKRAAKKTTGSARARRRPPAST